MKRSEARQVKRARVRRIKKIIARYNRVICSEKDAIRYLVKFHRTHGNLFQCECGNSELPEDHCTRKLKCSVCKRDWWITAGTLFDRVKKLRPYVIAIILKMNGMDVIPAELALVTGVADSTASEILKRIAMVVLKEMIGQFQEFSTLSLLGLYKRRSTATPRFSHPRAEEEPFQLQGPTEPVEESRAEGALVLNLSPQDALVYNEISTESISF
ncbi:MAG: hypothetical protein K2X93_12440, partial [Candidatus Obscuribacterales bacterium]|nr:hypothetical protein [Candidatus Obscuribacterales bacterium]